MRGLLLTTTFRAALLAGVLTAGLAQAQVPAPAPAPTITCKDGSTPTVTSTRGACRGHGGVQKAATPAPAPAPATPPRRTTTRAPLGPQAPGGLPGLVWVNTATKVYHCPTDRYYGRTKRGSYMTEQAAKAAGAHIERGETC